MSDMPSAHRLDVESLSAGLNTDRIARRIIVLPEIDSTNTFALQTLAPQLGADADGAVIFAERQTAGRGRLGRSWHSPAGASLMFTVLLHEPENVTRAAFWTMAAALAVIQGIDSSTDLLPQIRWPNDIYLGPRKLAGILVEAHLIAGTPPLKSQISNSNAFLAIGIGLNCLQHSAHFPADIRESATSLEIESKHPIDRLALARALLRALDHFFARPDQISDEALAAQWSARSDDIGQRVTLRSNGESIVGRILDIHPQTGLLLQLDTGARRHFDPATTSRA